MPTDISIIYPEFTNLIIQTYFFWMYDIWVEQDWQAITQVVPSTKAAEFYPTLAAPPKMDLWQGSRRFFPAGEKYAYSVLNAKYDTGIEIERSAFQDDQYGILMKKITDLAVEGKRKPMELAYNIINYGALTNTSDPNYCVGPDNEPLFSASHPGKIDISPSDTQSNTNGGSTALTTPNLITAVATMKKIYDNQGRPMGILPDTLLVPPDLEATALGLLNSQWFMSVAPGGSSGTPSTAQTGIPTFNVFNVAQPNSLLKKIISTPYITSSTAWYVACTTRPAKPVMLQERMPPELTIKMDPNTSDKVFDTDNIYASVLARWGAAPGDWHTIFQGST